MAPLTGKVAVITGGTKGIGRAVAIRLAKDGAKVAVSFSSDTAAAESLVQEIGKDHCLTMRADGGRITDCEVLIAGTVEKFGKIDILLPCAGYMPMQDLEHVTEESYEQVFSINVKGPLFLAQKSVQHMAQGSHIVFFSSTLCTASTVQPAYFIYCASKGAIEQMTKVLAKDLGKKGISVNAIAPGPTATPLFLRGKSDEVLKTIAGGNPYNRIAEPEDIADAVAFLCGSDSRWVNGQVLRVNGGMA